MLLFLIFTLLVNQSVTLLCKFILLLKCKFEMFYFLVMSVLKYLWIKHQKKIKRFHLTTTRLSLAFNKSIKFASSHALRTCLPGMSIMNTHTKIHNMGQRALPANVCMYKHAIIFYKIIQNIICEDEFLHLNFQLLDNERGSKFKFVKRQSYDVGKNILLNKMFDTINNRV